MARFLAFMLVRLRAYLAGSIDECYSLCYLYFHNSTCCNALRNMNYDLQLLQSASTGLPVPKVPDSSLLSVAVLPLGCR